MTEDFSSNSNSTVSNYSMPVRNRYDEVFEVEIDGWCFGIAHFAGEVSPALVHSVVRELRLAFREAVEHHFVFDVLRLSDRIACAAKYLVHEKEIAFSILASLPNPGMYGEDEQFVIGQIIDQVEQAYGGALDRVRRKWQWENERNRQRKVA